MKNQERGPLLHDRSGCGARLYGPIHGFAWGRASGFPDCCAVPVGANAGTVQAGGLAGPGLARGRVSLASI
jgi:hypothetical protein